MFDSRSIFYVMGPESWKWVFEAFPLLKPGVSSLSANANDWLIPLCNGPGHENVRLEWAIQLLNEATHEGGHKCALGEDDQQHSAAFYASALQRTELLKSIIEHEKEW